MSLLGEAASLFYFSSLICFCNTFNPSVIADVTMVVLLTSTFVLSLNNSTVLSISLYRFSDKRMAIRQSFLSAKMPPPNIQTHNVTML